MRTFAWVNRLFICVRYKRDIMDLFFDHQVIFIRQFIVTFQINGSSEIFWEFQEKGRTFTSSLVISKVLTACWLIYVQISHSSSKSTLIFNYISWRQSQLICNSNSGFFSNKMRQKIVRPRTDNLSFVEFSCR